MSTLLVPVLLALAVDGCRSARSKHGAPASSAPIQSAASRGARGPGPTKSGCSSIQACLRALPRDYDPARDQQIRGDVARCFGETAEDKFKARECSPIEFARDPRNGRGVEAFAQCGEVCIAGTTFTGIRYVDTSEPECSCLGGHALWFGDVGVNYGGCVPDAAPGAPSPHDFAIDEKINAGRPEYRVCFHPATARSALLRIPDTRIASLNGAAVRDARQLEDALLRMPEDPPREIRMAKTAFDRRGLEIHFIDRSILGSLVQAMVTLRFLELPASRQCGSDSAAVTVRIGARSFSNDLRCDDDETKRFREFIGQLEAATRSHAPEHRTPPPECNELKTLPTQFVLRRDDHDIDLRYVDWMKATGAWPHTVLEQCPERPGHGSMNVANVTGGQIENTREVLGTLWPDFLSCYRNGLAHDQDIEGGISLSIDVGTGGDVREVTANPTGNLPDSVASCLKMRTRKAHFTSPVGGPSVVQSEIQFRR